jgi:hypothetical protein
MLDGWEVIYASGEHASSGFPRGDLKEVEALLSKNFDVNCRSKDGGTALVSASWIGHLDRTDAIFQRSHCQSQEY